MCRHRNKCRRKNKEEVVGWNRESDMTLVGVTL